MNANYTDIAESVNKEFTPQYRGILEDTDIFPLNKLLGARKSEKERCARVKTVGQIGVMRSESTLWNYKLINKGVRCHMGRNFRKF